MSLASSANPPRIAVKLKRKKPATEHDGPVLVRFPHGPPLHLTKPELADDIEFKMYANPDERKSFQRILLAQTPGVTYVAPNFGSQQSYRQQTAQYAIGVFDASKNKLKMIPCNHVYRMDQHVAALDSVEGSAAAGEETWSTQQRVLADTFGSRKRQKQLQSRAANQVTVQESTSQVLTHAVGSIVPNTERVDEDALLEQMRRQVLPAYNADAENVRDIYPATSVLPDHLLDGLTVAAKRWRAVLKKGTPGVSKDAKSATPLSTSLFVRNRLTALAERGYEERDAHTVKMLIAFNLMMLFHAGGRNKRSVVEGWTPGVKSEGAEAPSEAGGLGVDERVKAYFLHTFTSSSASSSDAAAAAAGASAARPSFRFDGSSAQKLLCHLAVTSLHLANFTLDADQIDALSQDLKMMPTDMMKYYAEVGCTVSKVRIHLSAPLKLPKMRKKIEKK